MADSVHLAGLSFPQLQAFCASLELPRFRAKQLWQWMHQRGACDVETMKNLGAAVQQVVQAHSTIARPIADQDLLSNDGTRKWLYRFEDGHQVETVFIPESDRGTLCISSQIGCTLSCTFCHTGTQKLVRNLTAAEIVGQVMAARDALEDWERATETRRITNIVLMGMGEPLFNYEQVALAMQILMDKDGMAISRKRITLSTSGHVPYIRQCADELGLNLAISLHAVHDELRDVLVPLNKRWNIAELLEGCRYYSEMHPRQRVTFEYVMLDGVNDSDAEARRLVKLLSGIPSKVNLIPFNPWPGSSYVCSGEDRIRSFANIIALAGYMSPVRTPRGQDILAACGQLKSASEKLPKC